MAWNSNHHPGTAHKSSVSHNNSQTQGDNEYDMPDEVPPPSRPGAWNRRGSNIVITNEFSIERNRLQQQKTETGSCDQDDITTARSLNQDKPEGKSPYYHV
ncbi:hypothetical protein ACJQWK_09935 [Exserohilum turcicum]|uniref:Uncharacterized protein n=1 Tax=Exserohilum turcicum (strain 28A) TaxID=671987 RepID=R0IAL8_EXST2|nr:uncharacterized protein SETTUDRAFT_40321 [Exserohilum turcica Et28A]EOA82361.1 hypothetical protein SETTUDRAFT_40321 [Exserohilum turcica Et28A]